MRGRSRGSWWILGEKGGEGKECRFLVDLGFGTRREPETGGESGGGCWVWSQDGAGDERKERTVGVGSRHGRGGRRVLSNKRAPLTRLESFLESTSALYFPRSLVPHVQIDYGHEKSFSTSVGGQKQKYGKGR
jgi:hypothetical protein